MSVPGWLSVLDGIGFFTVHTLLSLLWQSSILLGAVGILTSILRHKRESIRYSLWLAAVLVMPVIPLLTHAGSMLGTPQAEISVFPTYSNPQTRIARTQLKMKLPEGYRPRRVIRSTSFDQSNLSPAYPAPQAFEMGQDEQLNRFSIKYYPWAAVLVVYSSIVLILLMWVAAGRLRIRHWIYNGYPVVNTDVISIFHHAARHVGLTRDFIVIESDDVPAPMTCRTFHPIIVLPTGFSDSLSASELMAVALHELTHVKRNDVLIMTFVSFVRTIFFFHPLVWFATRQISYLSEIACDDAVLESSLKSTSYAGMLARMAANLPNTAYSTELAAGIIFSKSVFFRRIEIILSNRNERFRRVSLATFAGTVIIAALSLVIALALPLGYAQDKEEAVTLSGKVVYKGTPVSGVDIYINDKLLKSFEKVAKTDRSGAYSLEIPQKMLQGQQWLRPTIIAGSPKYAVGWVSINRNTEYNSLIIDCEDSERLSGTVVDENGKPLADAYVSANVIGKMTPGEYGISLGQSSLPELTVKTDRRGRFSLTHLPELSSITVVARKKGYSTVSMRGIQAGMESVEFALKPEGCIQGKITFGDSGKPVKDVDVTTASPDNIFSTIDTSTDSNGCYTLSGLSSGMYTVSVNLDNTFKEWDAAPKENVTVEEGKTTDSIDLTFRRGGTITGRIINVDIEAPIAGHRVYLYNKARASYQRAVKYAVTDENGYFTLAAIPGKAMISTYAPDGYEDNGRIEREVTVTQGISFTLDDFKFRKGVVLHGTVRTFSGEPVEGAAITDNFNTFTLSGKNGEFTLKGLKPGANLALDALHTDKKIKGSVDLKIQPNAEVEILLEKYETTGITGRVINPGNNHVPVVRVDIVLWDSDRGRGITAGSTLTDESGMYVFENLIVGSEYTITVTAEGYRTPNVSHDDHFIAAPDMPHYKDLAISKGDRWLEGKVQDVSGKPVAGASLSVSLGGPSGRVEAVSDANGHYRLDGLIGVMIHLVSVNHKDFGRYRFEYVPTNLPYNFELVKGNHSISGKVVDTEGNPVMNAHIYTRDQYHAAGTVNVFGRSSDNGLFTIDGIMEGTVKLAVSTSSREYKHKEYGPFITDGKEDVTLVLIKNTLPEDTIEYVPSVTNTQGPYTTHYMKGEIPVTVDGDLADWTGLDIDLVNITEGDMESNEKARTNTPQSLKELSARFMCIADDDYVYMAVDVTDDNLYFKNPGFDSAWNQDCVEIFFFGDNKKEFAGQLHITAYENGDVMLSGRDPITNERYPYFWEAVGVRAALKVNDKGYTAEIAVPWSVLQWSGWEPGHLMGMNVRVYDTDVDEGERSRYLVEWANVAGEDYREIVFTGLPEGFTPGYRSKDLDRIHSIFTGIKEKDWDSAEDQFRAAGNGRWVKPMLGRVLQLSQKEDESISVFAEILHEPHDSKIEDWIIQSAYRQAMPLRSGGEYAKIISTLEPLVVDCENRNRAIVQSKLLLGQCYFRNSEYEKARKLMVGLLDCDESIRNYYGQSVQKDAQRMIDSIDRVLMAAQ